MKNIASSRLEDWLEEDEDINQNLDFKQKVFYNDESISRSFSDKKDDDPFDLNNDKYENNDLHDLHKVLKLNLTINDYEEICRRLEET